MEDDDYVEEGNGYPEGVSPSKIIAMEFALRACVGLTEKMDPAEFMGLAKEIHQFILEETPMETIH